MVRSKLGITTIATACAAACGCASWSGTPPLAAPPIRRADSAIQPVAFQAPASPAAPDPAAPLGVDDLVRLAVERNPRLSRATLAVDAARGRHLQAGLYPNPELAANWDEIGDRTAFGGVVTAPRVTQTVVTGRKLSLAQAVAAREIDQAALDVLAERYAVVGSVRAAFYEAYALQRRGELLAAQAKLADDAVPGGQTLLENKRIARLDLVELEVERARARAEALAVARELPAAYRRLAALAGDPTLPVRKLVAAPDALPRYDLDATRATVLATHPEVRAAQVAVERAQAALRLAEAQSIPNVTLSAGFIRQFENKSYDGALGVSVPVAVWNRNQGNIRAARAELAMAAQGVAKVESDLTDRLATAFRTYVAAAERAEQYRTEVVPRTEETHRLSLEAFKGGQFEYPRVIQAQRAVGEARLEMNKSLGEAWRAAGELSGLLLEEAWPALPAAERR